MKPTEDAVDLLQQWGDQLDRLRLPVPAALHRRASVALRDSERSLRDIADLVQQSPSLALTILREANSAQRRPQEPALSLEVAISRLGLQRTAALLRELPAVEEQEMPLALRQLLLISQHASTQASGLFSARLARLWQEIHWCSLLFMAPYWALLCAHPELFERWAQRSEAGSDPREEHEHELFSVPLVRLGLLLAERWNLPEWIARGYRLLLEERRNLVKALHIARDHAHPLEQRQRLDADPELQRWLTQPANTVLLANGLALSAHDGWGTPHHLRWQYLTALYLEQPLDEVNQAVHQQAASSARQHKRAGLWHPAEALIWPWDARGRLAPVQRNSAPAPSDPHLEWRRRCTLLLAEPSPFADLAELAECAARALHACGMRQVLLCDVRQGTVSVLHYGGWGGTRRPAALSLDDSPLLKRLLATQGRLKLDSDNAARLRPLLPPMLRRLFVGDLLMACLGNAQGPELLLLSGHDGEPVGERRQQVLDKTLQCIERALKRLNGDA